MSDVVRARLEAVKLIGHGVDAYGRALQQALTSARSDLNAAAADFQLAVVSTERRLDSARQRREAAAAALAACEEGCEPLVQALADAQVAEDLARRDHENNRQVQEEFEQTAAQVRSSMQTTQSAAEQIIPPARRKIAGYGQALADFLRRELAR